jgi:hypothetical protein
MTAWEAGVAETTAVLGIGIAATAAAPTVTDAAQPANAHKIHRFDM